MTGHDQSEVFDESVLTQTTTKDISKTSSVTIKVDDDVSNKKYIGRVSGIPEIMGICGGSIQVRNFIRMLQHLHLQHKALVEI